MLASLNGGHRRLEVQYIGRAVVEDLNRRVLDDGAPVRDASGVAIAARCGLYLLLIASANGDERGMRWGRSVDIVEGLEGVAMRLAHEGVAEHADAQRRNLAMLCSSVRHREPSFREEWHFAFTCVSVQRC